MEAFGPLIALVLLAIAASLFGADSRTVDDDRANGWWPANPR